MPTDLPASSYAPDGSPVPLYRRLPPRADDAALIHVYLPPRATVLDLGCGTGRLAEPLAGLGHHVTGVDNEPQMVEALHRATGVLADLTTLDLNRRFDAVLLMSNLVNSADPGFVAGAFQTIRRHLAEGGVAVVERFPPGWVHGPPERIREVDGVRYTLRRLALDGEVRTAAIRYEFDGLRAEQRFSARDVDDTRLAELAAAAGLDPGPGSPVNPEGTIMLLRTSPPAAR